MKPGTVFYKMSGSGNDFVVFDGRYADLQDFTPERIREVCDRRHGAGADGAILLDPSRAPAGAHFYFHFWNSDGSEGPMCGNGALCATRVATLIELAPADQEVVFAARAGIHRGRVLGERSQIHLPDCPLPQPVPDVRTAGEEQQPTLVVPSVPHLVLVVDDVEKVDLEHRGPPLRHDPALGAGGANVNWVSPTPDGSWRMRTYERGVEGETMACGTGAVACALTLEAAGKAAPGARLWTRSGRPLDITWKRSRSGISDLRLTGEARLVYRGVLAEPPNRS